MENINNKFLSARSIFAYSWDATKAHFGKLIIFSLITIILSLIISVADQNTHLGLFSVIFFLLQGYLALLWVSVPLYIVRRNTFSLKLAFKSFRLQDFISFMIASLVLGLMALLVAIVLSLLIALVIPTSTVSIIMAVAIAPLIAIICLTTTLFVYSYLIVDKEYGPWRSLKEGFSLTSGHRWHIFQIIILVVLINIVGALIFGVGLFITVPLGMIALAKTYDELLNKKAN